MGTTYNMVLLIAKKSINQSIKYSFIDKKDNPPDTNASEFYRRVGDGKDE